MSGKNDVSGKNSILTAQDDNHASSTIGPSFFKQTGKYKNIREKNWLLRMSLLIPGSIVVIFFKTVFLWDKQSNPTYPLALSLIQFFTCLFLVVGVCLIINLFRKQKITNVIYRSTVITVLIMAILLFISCSLSLGRQ